MFKIPLSNLQTWSASVISSMSDVRLAGRSKVHLVDADCEMHLGGRSPNYTGFPDGLVLEPMNCCSMAFPGSKVRPTAKDAQQDDKVWLKFGNDMIFDPPKHGSVTAIGVPRIWPEHLDDGKEPSNPNHAIEFHPLTGLRDGGDEYDFSALVSAGDFKGHVGTATGPSILRKTRVKVKNDAGTVTVSFFGGQIENFTTLDLEVDPSSVVGDGRGSFRASGNALLDDGTAVAVRMVTAAGSQANDVIGRIRSNPSASRISSLILFSLSPQALLDAANKSQGNPIDVDRPIQLILYGAPE
ncbi:MAG: hypothetical protein HYR64_00735 [Fimbriimonas ginsengisoli]|uniref:S5 DRBM domain-containing protein n=1 Tax=Fimbriimonas ginsengisoli TaxID=1005039 RepID=A0A931LTN1_FIMGI|nr:hypothetical protein [Fimbriimonas ginsengisoli]